MLYPRRTEIDFRDEFNRLLFGDHWEIGKEQLYIYRRMRRDAQDKLISCVCQSKLTDEGEVHVTCPYCFGEGFLWDDAWVSGILLKHRTLRRRVERTVYEEFSVLHPDITFMYLVYTSIPTVDDKILAPQIDTSGQIVWPPKIINDWNIDKADPMRGDYGRVEYWFLTLRARSQDRPR